MTTFYLVRHGETENNKNRMLSGWVDTPLTEQGKLNAAAVADKLEGVTFDAIVASDLGRARSTAAIIAKKLGYTGKIEKYQGLNEINYGDFGNSPIADYPRMTAPENASFIFPNGESLEQMQRRVMDWIREISIKYPDKTVLMVAHDGTINSVRASYANENIGIVDGQNRNPYDGVVVFDYADGKVTSLSELKSPQSHS